LLSHPSAVQLSITCAAYHWSERRRTPVGESSGNDQLARRIVSMQAGSGGFGPCLAGCDAPLLLVLITALGGFITATSRPGAQ
jgi:hypothetical protein